ncbi:hypothetical protein ACH427_19185 [Streptomyces sp. NPDC020379]|uniref:DUF7848 domain-containing protein n=1 Tax=Streptomyces sp. NPDC020379 TaxID=3365071 RepID=UPI00379DC60A
MTGSAVKLADSPLRYKATRTTLKYVPHTITVHPDLIIYGANCCGCDWKTRGHDDQTQALDECLAHSGRSGHRSFRPLSEGFAFVVRADEKVKE